MHLLNWLQMFLFKFGKYESVLQILANVLFFIWFSWGYKNRCSGIFFLRNHCFESFRKYPEKHLRLNAFLSKYWSVGLKLQPNLSGIVVNFPDLPEISKIVTEDYFPEKSWAAYGCNFQKVVIRLFTGLLIRRIATQNYIDLK